jgi:PKHD-type hydroxylase
LTKSGVVSSNTSRYDENFRDSNQVNVNSTNPVVEKVREVAQFANENYFKINISEYCKESHFLEYGVGGKFETHTDTIYPAIVNNINANKIRKLSSITLLNDHFSGGKLALWFKGERYSFEFNPGDIIFFPAFIQHKIDPIVQGVRYSLVSWSYGEY